MLDALGSGEPAAPRRQSLAALRATAPSRGDPPREGRFAWLVRCARGLDLGGPKVPSVVCVAIGAIWLLPAVYDLFKLVSIARAQLEGPALGTDFLNMYAGASLFTQQPEDTYRLDAQLAVQRTLTARDSMLVPFYLPPYSALLLAWLGWLPYGLAYLVWLAIGFACVVLAIVLLAPRLTGWNTPVWLCLQVLYLPILLGLAQGQTSAITLLACAAFARVFLDAERKPVTLIASAVAWVLKPQFAPVVLVALLAARRRLFVVVAGAGTIIGLLTALALARLGPTGMSQLSAITQNKVFEALFAEPVFLIGPTLLHASHWFFGLGAASQVLAVVLIGLSIGSVLFVWRSGPADAERRPLQLAILPIVAVIAAPYALVYEMAPWIVSFWLLWRFTTRRPTARAALLWLVAGTWLSANIGVAEPRAGGADVAAAFGLGWVAFIVWQFRESARLAT